VQVGKHGTSSLSDKAVEREVARQQTFAELSQVFVLHAFIVLVCENHVNSSRQRGLCGGDPKHGNAFTWGVAGSLSASGVAVSNGNFVVAGTVAVGGAVTYAK
jgi:hypothetical protein